MMKRFKWLVSFVVIGLMGLLFPRVQARGDPVGGELVVLPSVWFTEWLQVDQGVVRCLLGDVEGHGVDEVEVNTVRLNDLVLVLRGRGRVLPRVGGFSGPALEMLFPRQEALASLGWVEPGGRYPAIITGLFSDGTEFRAMDSVHVQGEPLVDDVPPALIVNRPADGTTGEDRTPLMEIVYDDGESGIDLQTLQVVVNGLNWSGRFSKSEGVARYPVPVAQALPMGESQIIASIEDNAGNRTMVESRFTVGRFRAMAGATPPSGLAPLTVTFTEAGEDPRGTIVRYRWDFQGDGSWDTCDEVATLHYHTYLRAGVYDAVLEVRNQASDVAYDTVIVVVETAPPTATAHCDPSNGGVPLAVRLHGAGTDPDGHVVLYEWDFDGDGIYDWSSSTVGVANYTYTESGVWPARFRVMDDDGQRAVAEPILTEVRVGLSGAPTALGEINPRTGDAPLSVAFFGRGIDPDGHVVLYEWDFEGDGSYDWSSSTEDTAFYTYEVPDVYYPAFRVTDDDGLTGVYYTEVSVRLAIGLLIDDPDRTFNPNNAESLAIEVTLSAPLQARLYLRNADGALVRTLFDGHFSPAGTYSCPWDGRDDEGNILIDGPYYAVLDYFHREEWRSYDLTWTTGGVRYLPTRESTGGSESHPVPVSPFRDQFLPIRFSTVGSPSLYNSPECREVEMGPSEITLFAGFTWSRKERVRTILNRFPFSAGHHIVYWDGLDDGGEVPRLEHRNSLVLGCWGYTMPKNVVFLAGGRPEITDVVADPNYFSAFSEKCDLGGEGEGVTVMFHLSEPSAVSLRIYSLLTGSLVWTTTKAVASAGFNDFFWDGKNGQGRYADVGDYHLGLVAVDGDGNQSMVRYAVVRFIY